MKVTQFEVGSLGTNCYVVYCETTKKAAVIDPGADAATILQLVKEQKLDVRYIINTHGHVDHIGSNADIQHATGAEVLIHAGDAEMLTNAQRNLSVFVGESVTCEPANRLLADGDIVDVGNVQLKVLYTPGHTPGGISLLTKGILFSGDTLFAESVGRTDLPGGSYEQLLHSIRDKMLVLDDGIKVFPGHGPATTIGWERRMNPFIQ
jgi:hydroxyacylglutathione hydrolase